MLIAGKISDNIATSLAHKIGVILIHMLKVAWQCLETINAIIY